MLMPHFLNMHPTKKYATQIHLQRTSIAASYSNHLAHTPRPLYFLSYKYPEPLTFMKVDLWGSWAQQLSCVPCFLFLGSGPHSASMTFSEFQGAGSASCWSGKGGDAKIREEESSKNSAALGQYPGSLSRDTYNNAVTLHVQVLVLVRRRISRLLVRWRERRVSWGPCKCC